MEDVPDPGLNRSLPDFRPLFTQIGNHSDPRLGHYQIGAGTVHSKDRGGMKKTRMSPNGKRERETRGDKEAI